MGLLEGKKTIVTGSASGIGRAIAQAFAAEGARVACLDRNLEGAKAVAAEIGGGAFALKVDVASESSVDRQVAAAIAKLGGIDVMVNNAGIATANFVVNMPLKQWQQMLDVDLTSVFLGCRAVLPAMIAQKSGRIINTGSQLGLCGAPGIAHYCAAKGGVHALTKSIAHEVAKYGINVNAIAPGPIDTPILDGVAVDTEAIRTQTALKRFGKPEEIAPTVVLLASDVGGANYTGSVLNVSGGYVMY